MKLERKPLSWKPRRRGRIYCSSACGRGCTKAEYDEAVKYGTALLKRVKGEGWKLQVWENLGWHYSIYRDDGHLSINPSGDRCYVMCSMHVPFAGDPSLQIVGYSSDPNRLVEKQRKLVWSRIEAMLKFYDKTFR